MSISLIPLCSASLTFSRYVLSTTHLHEFKSPDRIASQAPVMSLALADQKLGSHSNADSTSHKFMLKGRQSGGMHRGHAWVFRAESHDTMLAWFSDIKNLTEKTGAERNAFIQRSHARSVSAGSHKAGSVSSDGLEEDEADEVPYSATPSQADISAQQEKLPERPNPGGRFPSALNVDRGSHVPLSPSSNESSGDHEILAAAGALPGPGIPFSNSGQQVQAGDDEKISENGGPTPVTGVPLHHTVYPPLQQVYSSSPAQQEANRSTSEELEGSDALARAKESNSDRLDAANHSEKEPIDRQLPYRVERHDSKYGDWMGPTTGKGGGGAVGAAGIEAYRHEQNQKKTATQDGQLGLQAVEPQTSIPTPGATQIPFSNPLQGGIFAAIPSTAGTVTSPTVDDDQSAPSTTKGSPLHLNGPAKELAEAAERPPLGSRVNTISDLHLPGEFPKGK